MDENKTVNISLPKALLDAIDKQAEVEFRNRSDLIREAVRTYIAGKGGMNASHRITRTEHARIENAFEFANYKEEPAVVLSCVLRPQPNSIEDIFAGDSAVVKLVENPPRIRKMGWDLQTLDRAKPVAGEYLEVANGKRKVLRTYRDGHHVFAAGMSFFGHGVNNEPTDKTNLNLLSIAECIANFVIFSKQAAKEAQKDANILIYTIAISNPLSSSKPLALRAYDGISTDEVGELELEWVERNIIIVNPETLPDMKIAYQIYAELCYFFGLKTDQFWYVNHEKQEIRKEDFIRQG